MKLTEYLGACLIGMLAWYFISAAIDKYFPEKEPKPTPPCTKIILQGSYDQKTWFTIDSITLNQ